MKIREGSKGGVNILIGESEMKGLNYSIYKYIFVILRDCDEQAFRNIKTNFPNSLPASIEPQKIFLKKNTQYFSY